MAKGAEFRIDRQDRINYFSLVKRPRLLRVVIATCALSLFSTANPANADGSLDTSFDTDGKVTTAIGSSDDVAFSVAIQSDGKIVAAGYSNNGSNNDFALARYNTDGSLGGSSPGAVVDNSAAQAAAAAQRETEKRNARAKILDKYQKSESIPITLFAQAEIAGITEENDKDVQAEMAAIPEISRVDITQVLKIARKYEVVGRIASEQVSTVYSSELIEVGLISAESKHKAALTAAIKKLPVDERSSYAEIKEAIDNEMAEIQARKDRLANVLALIASRNN